MITNDNILMYSTIDVVIYDLTKKIHRILREESMLTVEQCLILSYLNICDNISHQTLCELTHKDKPSITRLIDKLESKKFVQRVPDVYDKRKKCILLTSDGRREYAKMRTFMREILHKAIANIDNHQLRVFLNVLNRLIENL